MFRNLCVWIVSLCLGLPALATEPPPVSIQVIVDQSAALQKPEEALRYEKLLLAHIAQLRKRRSTRDADIRLISVNNPRNLWVGTPRRLFLRGQEVLPRLAVVENGCADLQGAFEQVRTNLQLQRAAQVWVYVFSSLIHTGAPCDQTDIYLPQQPPKGLDLGFLGEAVSTLQFFWVHPLQEEPWTAFLQKQGILGRWRQGALEFGLHDEESTKTQLEEGL